MIAGGIKNNVVLLLLYVLMYRYMNRYFLSLSAFLKIFSLINEFENATDHANRLFEDSRCMTVSRPQTASLSTSAWSDHLLPLRVFVIDVNRADVFCQCSHVTPEAQ